MHMTFRRDLVKIATNKVLPTAGVGIVDTDASVN